MRHIFVLLLVLALVLIAGAAPSFAATGSCSTNPSSAITGADIAVTCSGLAPGKLANVYLVEPDGRTQSGNDAGAPVSADPPSPRADGSGIVTFTVHTMEFPEARAQLGEWKVVADNPGGNSAVGSFTLKGNPEGVSGADLTIDSVSLVENNIALKITFSASGFAPGEQINGWFDLPLNCSGMSDMTELTPDLAGVSTVIAAADLSFPSTRWSWKADAGGSVSGAAFLPIPLPCTGTYKFTLRALGSGAGASAEFVWSGNRVSPDGSSSINVTVLGSTANPLLDVEGSGFPPGAGVNCWATRPDGRTQWLGDDEGRMFSRIVDAAGSFSLTATVDLDLEEPAEHLFSAEPGLWSMTCATPDHVHLATTSFWLYALPLLDP